MRAPSGESGESMVHRSPRRGARLSAILAVAALAILSGGGCGSTSGGDGSTGFGGQEVETFRNPQAVLSRLDEVLDGGCADIDYYEVEPAYPESVTADALGISEIELFLTNEGIDAANCVTGEGSGISLQRYRDEGLTFDDYRSQFENEFLLVGCGRAPSGHVVTAVLWHSGRSLWNLGFTEIQTEGGPNPLPLETREARSRQVAALTGGSVIVHEC